MADTFFSFFFSLSLSFPLHSLLADVQERGFTSQKTDKAAPKGCRLQAQDDLPSPSCQPLTQLGMVFWGVWGQGGNQAPGCHSDSLNSGASSRSLCLGGICKRTWWDLGADQRTARGCLRIAAFTAPSKAALPRFPSQFCWPVSCLTLGEMQKC